MAIGGSDEALSEPDVALVEQLLRDAGVEHQIESVEIVWERRHLLRLHTEANSFIVKRAKILSDGHVERASLRAECVALTLSNRMQPAIAPRLLGADLDRDLLVMEDLPPGLALSDLVLLGGEDVAVHGLLSIARALATLHTSSSSWEPEFDELEKEMRVGTRSWQNWLQRAIDKKDAFLEVVTSFGVSCKGVGDEIDTALRILDQSPRRGLLHGDLCPDNVRVSGETARIFDFEASSFGPWALDVAYILAPFPSCWCFAEIPIDVVDNAINAYTEEAIKSGATMGHPWQAELVAALVCFVIVRVAGIVEADPTDEVWGTTTMRPRIITWLMALVDSHIAIEVVPAIVATAAELVSTLRQRWPDIDVPSYPAFARGRQPTAKIPEFWQPGL